MITKKNYFDQVGEAGLGNLPEELKKAHQVIVISTNNGQDWSIIEKDKDFKQVADLAFGKLDEFIHSREELSGIFNKPHEEIRYFKTLLKWEGKVVSKQSMIELIRNLQAAIIKGKIHKGSPYAKEINLLQKLLVETYNDTRKSWVKFLLKDEMVSTLKKAIENSKSHKKPTSNKVSPETIDPVGLHGLNGCPPEKPACVQKQLMSSVEFSKMKFDTIGLKDKWLTLIGDPCKGFTAMVFGRPKMGKSYLCIDFAGYLARNHGKVLYVAKEEKLDLTLQEKLKEINVAHSNLIVSDYLPEDLSTYDFIFLDSINTLGLTPKIIEQLRERNPGKSFILVFQTIKSGNFRGANTFQHNVDIVIEVPEKGKAVQFGRFNQGGEMTIFIEIDTDTETSTQDSLQGTGKEIMLAGSNKKGMKKKQSKIFNSQGKAVSVTIPDREEDDWTQPKHLSEKDHSDLRSIKHFYEEGKFKEAMEFASNLDTIVREEIPGDIWKEIGGKLTKTGEEKLKKRKEKISGEDLKKFDSGPDALNPRYIFSLTSTQLLTEALKGNIDLEYHARRELANRGVDENGLWVGFKRAGEIHNI